MKKFGLLYISNNRLTSLLGAIDNLENLTSLGVEINNFRSIPEIIVKWEEIFESRIKNHLISIDIMKYKYWNRQNY